MWIIVFTLFAALGIVLFMEGDARRHYLQGALAGSIVSVIVLINVFVFVAMR